MVCRVVLSVFCAVCTLHVQTKHQCPVFSTNLEGKVGKVGKVGNVGKVGRVGKVGKVGKEGSTGSTGRQLPPLSSVLYRIISKRRYILDTQLLLREKSGT